MNKKYKILGLTSLLGIATFTAYSLTPKFDVVSQNDKVYAASVSTEEKLDDNSESLTPSVC